MPIKSLPDEFFMKVFGFLDIETLKNAALVCKKWNELIRQTTMNQRTDEPAEDAGLGSADVQFDSDNEWMYDFIDSDRCSYD